MVLACDKRKVTLEKVRHFASHCSIYGIAFFAALLLHYYVAFCWPVRGNMASYTKPKVCGVSQRQQRATDPG